ncbi:MAG TPA: A24 family peptidase [Gemmataceae bacterium]|nr:A24 family peptidase [Gemmataceae bacterium]
MVELQPVPSAVVLSAALAAAITDVWKFRVYNALTLPLLLAGLLYHGVREGPTGLALSVIGMLCGFGVLIVFYLLGGYGGGDVKLLAAVGAWLGPETTLYVFVASSLVAGVYALAIVLWYGRLGEIWKRWKVLWFRLSALGRSLGADDGYDVEQDRIDRRRVVPFAAMMCLGVIATLLYLWLWGQKS